jgi:hypothetical protein
MKKMKKIKIIFTLLLFGIMTISCEKDGGSSKVDFAEGAVINIVKIPTSDQGIDIKKLQSGGHIDMGSTYSIVSGDVASIDIIGLYTKGTVTEKAVFKKGISTFPANVSITDADLYTGFAQLSTPADFALTDKLIISTDITLKNGTVIKMYDDKGVKYFGADISNSLAYAVSQDYLVNCPYPDASQFDGDYKVVEDGWQDYSVNEIIPVQFTDKYTFHVLNSNNPFLINNTTSYLIVTVNPATNAVTVKSNESFNYGPGQVYAVTGSGTVGSCTGDIKLKLSFNGSAPYNLYLKK